jgi:hypothetical protein
MMTLNVLKAGLQLPLRIFKSMTSTSQTLVNTAFAGWQGCPNYREPQKSIEVHMFVVSSNQFQIYQGVLHHIFVSFCNRKGLSKDRLPCLWSCPQH